MDLGRSSWWRSIASASAGFGVVGLRADGRRRPIVACQHQRGMSNLAGLSLSEKIVYV